MPPEGPSPGFEPRDRPRPATPGGSPVPSDAAAPPSLPDHELIRLIARGSCGEVWLARSALGTLRAVEIVHGQTFWHDHPFEREFKGIQRFEPISRSHEGLADILQVGRGEVSEARSYVGIEGFIPPEGPGSAQADLYSLGKLLYEISTGKDRHEFPALPPDLDTLPDKLALIELNAVLLKACDPDPRQRHASAAAMRVELELLQQGGRSADGG